jgi:hypothetical protein
VRVLFVGEAPPASGRFFYQRDSGLYRALRGAFATAFPAQGAGDFLETFRARGCYLVDVCEEPVDRLGPEARAAACRSGEARLARVLARLYPEAVVTLVRSTRPNVRRAEEKAGWNGLRLDVPYPGRWHAHRVAFVSLFVPWIQAVLGRPTGEVDGVRSCASGRA